MRISVNADNREYSVQIGPGMIKEEGLFTGFRRAAVVTDETVAKLHLDTIMATLERAKVRAGSIILPPGEEIKSRDRLFDIYSGLMDNLIGRSDAVIAFGGGTVGCGLCRWCRPCTARRNPPAAAPPALRVYPSQG